MSKKFMYIGSLLRVTHCKFHNNISSPRSPCNNGCPGKIDGDCRFSNKSVYRDYAHLFINIDDGG